MTHNEIKTAAWISIPDFREVCKAVDSEMRAEFRDVFAQSRTLDKAMGYVDALSDPRARGNSWSIGEWCGYVSPRPVQSLIGDNKWDPSEVWDRVAVISGRLAGNDCEDDPLGPGVIVDETAQEKRGTATAGVGRQYAGCAGKVVNCTNWVFLTMTGPFMRTWAGAGLYIPKKSWFTGRKESGAARRVNAGIPRGTRFATKPGIARKLFRRLRAGKVRFNFAAGDEVYGRCKALRKDHERNREAYAYFVPRDFRAEIPGNGSMKLDDLLEGIDPLFEERSAGPGEKGLRYYEWALIALKSPRHFILVRRPCEQPWGNPGQPGQESASPKAGKQGRKDRVKDEKITFCLCFVPDGSPIKPTMRNLILMAGRRWCAEEGNETGKGPIGWDENQLRKFDSLQKHTALAGLAMLRSNIIIERLSTFRGTAPKGQVPEPGTAGQVSSAPQIPVSPPRERPGEDMENEVMIPLGDSTVPRLAGDRIPVDIGYVKLSRNETMRLRDAVMSDADQSEIEFRIKCSNWRRRHQAISKWHHHSKRLKAAAAANSPAGTADQPRKVTRRTSTAGSHGPTADNHEAPVRCSAL